MNTKIASLLGTLLIAGSANAATLTMQGSGAPTQIPLPGNAQVQASPMTPVATPAPMQQQPMGSIIRQPAPANLEPAAGNPAPAPIQQPQPLAAPAPTAAPVAAAPAPVPAPAAIPAGQVANIARPDTASGLYALATISPSVPMSKASLPTKSYKVMEPDAWRQIEFLPFNNQTFTQSKLQETILFKQQNWDAGGFRSVLTRQEAPVPFSSLNFPSTRLPKIDKKSKLKSMDLTLINGTVADGFVISDSKSDWFIYGQKNSSGVVSSLAISPDSTAPTDEFIKAVKDIAGQDLIIVDWYKDRMVDTSSEASILDWISNYRPSEVVKK